MPGIVQGWFGPFPQTTQAVAVDTAGNYYYGEAPRGASLNSSRWTIFQNFMTTALGAGGYITQYPVDTTPSGSGCGSDQGMFCMAHANQ